MVLDIEGIVVGEVGDAVVCKAEAVDSTCKLAINKMNQLVIVISWFILLG